MSWSTVPSSCGPRAAGVAAFSVLALALLAPLAAHAAQPDVKTVPWVASNPLLPHDAVSDEPHIVKGTSSIAGPTIEYTWDFGDGSPVATGAVVSTGPAGTSRNLYGIDATHTYTGAVGTVFTARLTVRDTSTGEADSEEYYVQIQPKVLNTDVNIAIDRGLWFLHKQMVRTTTTQPVGHWESCPWSPCNFVNTFYYGITPTNANAFLSNGHLETGSPDNPYTETVQRAMRRVFERLLAAAIPASDGPGNTVATDANGNGIGIYASGSDAFYQSGGFMNAIIATGTPNALTITGPANVIGRKYSDIVQDMVDFLAYCQYDDMQRGGWRYACENFPDNSVNQWVALGIIAAERAFGATIDPDVKTYSNNWLAYSQNATTGVYGYTDSNPAWGPYATTPSGLVQNVMIGQGRGNSKWDKAETFLRNNFCNTGGAASAIRDYYYGLFSLTKSMLLHDSNADGVAEPLTLLQSATPAVPPIDWYAAEAASGAPCNGVARTLVLDQNAAGYWYANDYYGAQYHFETAWAILMLSRSVFETGNPVAVATAAPNPAVAFQTINLSGAASFHQNPAHTIISWSWDLDNNGSFETAGVNATVSFPAVGNYPVKLKVCDDGAPQRCAETTVIVIVSTPPLAPTADAGGPYNLCENRKPWFLDGTGSTNPDDGVSEPGQPGDAIVEYAWDLDGNGAFDNASGAQPDVTAFFTAQGVGAYLISLRVKDRTATSFPSSGQPDLTDTDSVAVAVRGATDPACVCISDLAARPKLTKVQLTWTKYAALPAGGKYNVYRGTISGGPYLKIAETTSTYSTYLDSLALTTGIMYHYVVRVANAAGLESCQSNQASARPVAR